MSLRQSANSSARILIEAVVSLVDNLKIWKAEAVLDENSKAFFYLKKFEFT